MVGEFGSAGTAAGCEESSTFLGFVSGVTGCALNSRTVCSDGANGSLRIAEEIYYSVEHGTRL